MTVAEHLDAHVIFAPEGGIAVLTTSDTAGSFDLSATAYLGEAVKNGRPIWLYTSVATWVKFAETADTALDKTARATDSAGAGAEQGFPLAAGERVKTFIPYTHEGQPKTFLHVENVSGAGVVAVSFAGQELS